MPSDYEPMAGPEPISSGIKDKLVGSGIGVFENPQPNDWRIMIAVLQSEPDNCIAIFDNGGRTPEPKWLLDYPFIKVIVRGNDYVATFRKAREVKDRFLGMVPEQINGAYWRGVEMMGDIANVGVDDKHRYQFSLNFKLYVEPTNQAGDNRLPL